MAELFARSHSGNRTVSWKYDTGSEVIISSQPISLNESVMILVESNYTGSGVYAVNASINSSQYNDQANGVVIS